MGALVTVDHCELLVLQLQLRPLCPGETQSLGVSTGTPHVPGWAALTPRKILMALEQVTPVVPQGTFSVTMLKEPSEELWPQ